MIELCSSFTVLDTLHITHAFTTCENMADIGGIAIAWNVFKMTARGKDTTRIDGMNFTPFYEAFGVKEGNKMFKAESERIKIW